MKLKIHWGVGIAVFYTIFLLFLIGNVVFSSMQGNDIISPDYYQKELAYQQQIDKAGRSKKLPQQLKIVTGGSTIALQFPDFLRNSGVSGVITFYRPSDTRLDNKVQIKVNENNLQVIDTRAYAKGLWKLKIEWSASGIEYYNEESVMI
jgi:hypothetical protein